MRKQLMSEVRNEDYTHAGEEEAITIVMNNFLKDSSRKLLDVGAGLGGTANYIKTHGWGDVIGIDIEEKLVNYAKNQYPDIEFFLCDALNCDSLFSEEQFDLIYHFNSFYSFTNQEKALKALYNVGKPNSNLVIFDYLVFDDYDGTNPFAADNSPFIPINKNQITITLNNTGWQLQSFHNLTTKYTEWYYNIVNKLEQRKSELVNKFGEITFTHLYGNYTNLIQLFETKKLGGCIVYASKNS